MTSDRFGANFPRYVAIPSTVSNSSLEVGDGISRIVNTGFVTNIVLVSMNIASCANYVKYSYIYIFIYCFSIFIIYVFVCIFGSDDICGN